MKFLKINLSSDLSVTEIMVTPEYYNHSTAWRLKLSEDREAVIRQDEHGIWMQRAEDNLDPEDLYKIGSAISEQMPSG